MRRKRNNESCESLRIRQAEGEFYDLTRKCVRFMEDNGETIGNMKPKMPSELSNRCADNWEPLLSIAEFISTDFSNKLCKIAVNLTRINNQSDDDTSSALKLLFDIREIFIKTENKVIPSRVLCEKLAKLDERGWDDFGYRHEPIKPHHLARLIREFGIHSKDQRQHGFTIKCYFLADFQETFERYLPEIERDNATTAETESKTVAIKRIEI